MVTTVTTDKNGKATVKLVYGTYTVKQLSTSKNTNKVDDFKVIISEVGEKIYYTISNAPITAKLKVVKVDSETKEVIERANIKFKIKNVDTGEYVCQTVTYPTATKLCVFETDSNGVLITPNPLESGKYVLEEVDQVIDGYVWNKESVEFEIGDNAELITDSEYGVLFEVKFENTRVKGTVEVNKTGEEVELNSNGYVYNKINLDGVKIGIYANEDIYSNGKLIYEKDTLVETLITDKDGYAKVENLYLGKYYLQEIETVKGHVLDTTKYKFELTYKDQYTEVITYETTLKNHIPTGSLEFTKTDFSESKALPDTTIEIYTENDELVYTGVTDENGKIVIDRLPIGKYYILEKNAPEGYQLNTEKMYFEITEDGQVIKSTMKDELIVEVPNTLSNNYLPYAMVGLIVLGSGVILYGLSKNKKKK